METSVYVPSDRISLSGPIEPGRNVENIGLIAAQQKNLICAGVLVISGILLFGFGALGEAIRQEKLDVITKPRDQNSELL